MSQKKVFIKQSSIYLLGQILSNLSGLITFPIWTRFFTKEEYGIFNLINISVFFITGFTKLGLTRAAVRYYNDRKDNPESLQKLVGTTIYGIFIPNVITFLLLFLSILIYHSFYPMDTNTYYVLLLASFILVLHSTLAICSVFFVAEQKAIIYNIIWLIEKYGNFILGIIFVVVFSMGIFGAVLGRVIASTLLVGVLFFIVKKIYHFKVNDFSIKVLKEILPYSLPFIGIELADVILNIGDRYVIQMWLGASSVGLYSVGYNMAQYINHMFTYPFRMSVEPYILKIYKDKGKMEAENNISAIISYYFMFGIPMTMGIIYIRVDLINILASAKYAEAAVFFPIIAIAFIIFGLFNIFNMGLVIGKRSNILFNLTLIVGILNIVLNIILIPIMGILGAAYTTLFSYILLIVLEYYFSNKIINLRIRYLSVAKYFLFSLIMIQCMSFITVSSIMSLILQVICGCAIYLILLLLTERKLLLIIKQILSNIRSKN